MNTQPLMQQVLGTQWAQLPPALQAHYQQSTNTDVGALDIDYPAMMQPYLSFLRLFGALVNRRGKAIPTTVEKWMESDTQRWKRTITFPDGKAIFFKSHWVYAGGNEVIEYVSPFMGLRMAVSVVDGRLHYSGKHLVLKLGNVLIPIPEWLVLGHTTIVETALNEDGFAMDFRLMHPWFGEVFRYAGKFTTVTKH
ncbi:DUF4166 domain-containing protein [Thiothrix lacustris]|uniref:DUF4166 domain-containing protein n=1 Tax=Thiothrix lacustris TaxID=525917 RepID=A0ABY9MPM0_9GAMM|nr:DUF4166 domain-containing protein [Thiothrix lacustris]WML89330.1 DUF4166 domain-containing protein [Thiothrix lacustris]